MVDKLAVVLILLIFVMGSTSAVFEENVGVKDKTDASVDRPFMNHVKAFTNKYIPPVYDLLKGIEGLLGS